MRTQTYPSDLSDAQWALIGPHLPVYPGGRPRKTDLRDVVDAVFYILRTGCQWRYLPKDFPPKSTVWGYFNEWRHNGTLEKIHDTLRNRVRQHTLSLFCPESLQRTAQPRLWDARPWRHDWCRSAGRCAAALPRSGRAVRALRASGSRAADGLGGRRMRNRPGTAARRATDSLSRGKTGEST